MTGSPLVLTSVRVENVGVLRDVTLAPAPGLTVISGESGSGKSLLIRAIDMALGGRVDGERVGPFADRARVTLEFQTGAEAPLWQDLSGFGIEADEMLVVSREWGREARGSLRVQGRSVPLGVVRQLFADSVDLVGQHEYQRLLRADSARRWLDALVDEELRDRVGRAWRVVTELDRERGELQAVLGRDDLVAELRTEVTELQQLGLGTESEADLRREADRLQHGERLFGLYRSASELLDGGGSIAAVVQVVRLLGEARRFDEASADVLDAAAEAQGILEDVRRRLYRLAEGVEFDDRRLEVIRERLDRMARMARRYDTDVAGLGAALREREDRLARLE
ncbi:MAG: AAA family ATPase, partial [Clostridia bacterium]